MVKNTENQVLAIVRDITNEKREQDYILKLSYKHHLTDLFNRRYFDDAVVRMDYAEYLPLSIIMIDVNGLKLTNDAFGHFAKRFEGHGLNGKFIINGQQHAIGCL